MRDFLVYGENKPKRKRGRKVLYGIAATAALKTVWESGGFVCGMLLYPSVKEYVAILKRDGDWKHSDEATTQLLAMSEATVRRRVSALRKQYQRSDDNLPLENQNNGTGVCWFVEESETGCRTD